MSGTAGLNPAARKGAPMTDEITMRARLQNVAAYRELCRAIRSGATHTLVNALIWLGLTAMLYQAFGPDPIVLAYLALGVAEVGVGLWKKARPTLESVLVDGLIVLGFGAFSLGRQFLAWQGLINWPISPISIILGIFWLTDAFRAFRTYGDLRRAFPERPSPEHIAWFDDLVHEIQVSDPHTDPLALDLPTRPHWRAKLLGGIAFFVADNGTVWLVGPDDFALRREKADRGTGYRRAVLSIGSERYPEFEIDDASWANYQNWMAGQQNPQPLA
jgi:hypothetical protein